MDRPIPPEPEERPKIRKAMRAARFMKWWATPIAGIIFLLSVLFGMFVTWYVGVAIFVIAQGVLFIVGYSVARCPHCGQVWWSGMGTIAVVGGWLAIAEEAARENETESFVCRRCRLDIGLGLRD